MRVSAVAAKRALLSLVADIPALQGVQRLYEWTGKAEREVIFCASVEFDRDAADMGTGRSQDLTVALHVLVTLPGGSAEDAEDRAEEIGGLIEDALAKDNRLTDRGVPGLLEATIAGGQMQPAANDDGAIAELVYRVQFLSHLR